MNASTPDLTQQPRLSDDKGFMWITIAVLCLYHYKEAQSFVLHVIQVL